MGKPARTAQLTRVLFLITVAVLARSPGIMAQTGDTPCAHDVVGSTQACGNASTARAVSSVNESESGTATPEASNQASTGTSNQASPGASNQGDWVQRWMRTVDEARASQPHFVAPIVTTHVVLVEQYRYDISRQQDGVGGIVTSNYGASRGLEIIPTTRLEIGISPPPYLEHQSGPPDGFGDLAFQVKYRAFSAPEGKGDYFIGVFFGGSIPTGTAPNGLGHAMLLPTLAAAKGIGPLDIQSTLAAGLPATGADLLGRTILFNTAVDYRIKGKVWPMVELNSTSWSGGALDGKKEVFLTPGLVVGAFPIAERLHLGLGAGVQIAVTQFHRYNHRWIASIRLPF
jgi:hypothetical protein